MSASAVLALWLVSTVFARTVTGATEIVEMERFSETEESIGIVIKR